jgi:hypothetical protein
VSDPVIDELYARTEGNPFFTEQLVATMVSAAEGVLSRGAALPARLAELLLGRVASCSGTAGTVLSAQAVASRPLNEELLGAVSGLDVDTIRWTARADDCSDARRRRYPRRGATAARPAGRGGGSRAAARRAGRVARTHGQGAAGGRK